jgi:hypothetical protein
MKKLYVFLLGLFLALNFSITNLNAQSGTKTFATGSFFVNMGVTPQTIANGLRPYGMIYELVNVYKVPVYWYINPTKAKDGIDLTFQSVQFRSGIFIIPAEFRTSAVNSRITYWTGLGVQGITSTSPITLDYFDVIKSVPRWTLDAKNLSLIHI